MGKEIYFMRHARDGWVDGQCVVDESQCDDAADYLKSVGFAEGSPVLASAADRAVVTAQNLASRLGSRVFTSEDLYNLTMRDPHKTLGELPRDMGVYLAEQLGAVGRTLWDEYERLIVIAHLPFIEFVNLGTRYCTPELFNSERYLSIIDRFSSG